MLTRKILVCDLDQESPLNQFPVRMIKVDHRAIFPVRPKPDSKYVLFLSLPLGRKIPDAMDVQVLN